jgi:hypothetical protein
MFPAITNIGKDQRFLYQMIKQPTFGVAYKVY